MTTSSTQTNEPNDRLSQHDQDADWVIVKQDGTPTKEDFELIDAAEARCWCGGSDADRCRSHGHSWPLCDVDQGELWPKKPEEISYQSQEEEEDERRDSNSNRDQHADKESSTDRSKEAKKKRAPRRMSVPPTSHNNGPFTKLNILTDLLDPTRNAG